MNRSHRGLRRLALVSVLHILSMEVLCPWRGAALEAGVARADLTPPIEMKASLGGYEASVSFYGEDLGPRVVRTAIALATAVW